MREKIIKATNNARGIKVRQEDDQIILVGYFSEGTVKEIRANILLFQKAFEKGERHIRLGKNIGCINNFGFRRGQSWYKESTFVYFPQQSPQEGEETHFGLITVKRRALRRALRRRIYG